MAYSTTVTGARCAFKITTAQGEEQVAFATGVSYTINHEHSPIFVLDQLEPKEYAASAFTVSVSCTSFRVPNASPISKGYQMKLQNILTEPDLKIAIYDRNGDEPLLVVDKVKFLGRSGGIAARGEFTESWDFAGILFWDEAGR